MKQIIFILCVFFAFITSSYAGELYRCIDRNGNTVITSNPQDGMKCELKESYKKPSPKKPTNKKRKVIVKEKEIPKTIKTRIKNCIKCCDNKIRACYNYTANRRLCIAEIQNDCVATCKSNGAFLSNGDFLLLWNDCWSLSDK